MLQSLGEEKKATAIEHFFALRPATVIVARDITPSERMLAAAEKYDIPLLSSKDSTSNVVADLVSLLNVELAPPHHPPRRADRGLRRGHPAGGGQRRGQERDRH